MPEQDLRSGIRTVTDLAAYFSELKDKAASLAAEFAVVDRGYFLPSEDEATLSVMVSYLQAREALFELIGTCREQIDDNPEDRDIVFLVGFAGAVILVDAARYLRELADGKPLVRRKFNQPSPELGIPGGSFDAIQKSLVNARQGLHLQEAHRHYLRNRVRLAGAAAVAGCSQLIRIIDGGLQRIDVSLSDFARAKLRTRSDQFMRAFGRGTVQRIIQGLQTMVATLMADKYVRLGHRPNLPQHIAAQIAPMLRQGDVLLVRKEHALTNYFLPGYWPHVAMCLGQADDVRTLRDRSRSSGHERWTRLQALAGEVSCCVLESMKDGVLFRDVSSPFASDSIVVMRPTLEPAEIAQAVNRGIEHEGKPYDFDFDFRRSDRLVCTEVVYRSFEGVGGLRFELQQRAGRPTLSGQDLVRLGISRSGFHPVMAFIPDFQDNLIVGDDLTGAIEKADRL